jgi:hypothetical protein
MTLDISLCQTRVRLMMARPGRREPPMRIWRRLFFGGACIPGNDGSLAHPPRQKSKAGKFAVAGFLPVPGPGRMRL